MITSTQMKILGELRESKTVKDIKQELHIQSQSLVPDYLEILKKKELIRRERIGNIYLHTINWNNPESYLYLELLSWEKISKDVKNILRKIVALTNNPVLIFGSYATNSQNSLSDVDIAILTKSKQLERDLEDIKLQSLLKLDIHLFSKKDFQRMISADSENVGKEILRKHIVLQNSKEFYHLALDKHQKQY